MKILNFPRECSVLSEYWEVWDLHLLSQSGTFTGLPVTLPH